MASKRRIERRHRQSDLIAESMVACLEKWRVSSENLPSVDHITGFVEVVSVSNPVVLKRPGGLVHSMCGWMSHLLDNHPDRDSIVMRTAIIGIALKFAEMNDFRRMDIQDNASTDYMTVSLQICAKALGAQYQEFPKDLTDEVQHYATFYDCFAAEVYELGSTAGSHAELPEEGLVKARDMMDVCRALMQMNKSTGEADAAV